MTKPPVRQKPPTYSSERASAARASVPAGQLAAQAQRLVEQAQRLLEQAVIAERARNTSWEVLGSVLGGVTKSAVHRRFGPAVSDWDEEAEFGPFVDEDDPDDDGSGEISHFELAHGQLECQWEKAAEIISAQGLIAQLNNASVALSGGPDVRVIGNGGLYINPRCSEDLGVATAGSGDYGDLDIIPLLTARGLFAEEVTARARSAAIARRLKTFCEASQTPAFETSHVAAQQSEATSLEERVSHLETLLMRFLAERSDAAPAD